jgi:hypothetical protein
MSNLRLAANALEGVRGCTCWGWGAGELDVSWGAGHKRTEIRGPCGHYSKLNDGFCDVPKTAPRRSRNGLLNLHD